MTPAPKNIASSSPIRKHSDIETPDDVASVEFLVHGSLGEAKEKKPPPTTAARKSSPAKYLVAAIFLAILGFVLRDLFFTPPDQRYIPPDAKDQFLLWVESHPYWGLGAFLIVIAASVVLLIPIGTPLTVGCGFIYKGVYGWKVGLVVATVVTMLGSALGAASCFLLGRYMMREKVRKWVRKYPLFDAIDTAAAEHGLRIMAMLYMTPILPLGPVSYMCGTTSMPLSSFVIAKVASLPLMLLYVFVGASTGTLLSKNGGEGEAEKLEKNKTVIVVGIVVSAVMIGLVSHNVRKELDKILERQKQAKHVPVALEPTLPSSRKTTEDSVEMGSMTFTRQRRHWSSTETEALTDGEAR